jgi:hypothetical protein
VYYILYASKATTPPSDSEFQLLLTQCHRNNSRLGITGLLLYYNSNYLQILEGEKETVKALYDIIYQDPRHDQVSILEEGEQTGRNFPDWAMGFKAAANGRPINLPAYLDLNYNQLLFNPEGKLSHPALPHLAAFYEKLNQSIK